MKICGANFVLILRHNPCLEWNSCCGVASRSSIQFNRRWTFIVNTQKCVVNPVMESKLNFSWSQKLNFNAFHWKRSKTFWKCFTPYAISRNDYQLTWQSRRSYSAVSTQSKFPAPIKIYCVRLATGKKSHLVRESFRMNKRNSSSNV